jgi:hypothetical protein
VSSHDAVLNGVAVGKAYRVCFQAYDSLPVFRLRRKLARLRPKGKTSLQRFRQIVAVRPVPSRPVRCITVDSPSHLYLVGEGFIPTHNSTTDVLDAVQWILNFPDIRILFLTGADDLALKFVAETKGHFIFHEGDPTLMNIFFPEFCVPEKHKESEFQFTCPVWSAKHVKRGEPTLLASSVGSTKSGLHFELIKADDSVTDKNAETPDQCQTVSKKLSLTKKLLRLGGYYYDFIGTRYDDEDHYGVILEKNVGEITTTRGRCWELTENKSTSTKILIGRGIIIKPDVAAKLQAEGKPVTYMEAGIEGCDLLIPHVMSYAWCIENFLENEETFEGQVNQNPRPATSTTFDHNTLVLATVGFDKIPFGGLRSITWDFAYSTKKGRDFSTGSVALWNDKGQMFIQDLVRARLKQNDLAQAVVDLAKKWHPFVIGIENSNGADFLEPAILDKARQTGDEQVIAVCSKIDWFRPDTTVDSKRMRMGTLHPPLMEGRLKFANYLPYLETLYKEFEGCMTSRSARNDIPDVISQQLRYSPRVLQMSTKNEVTSWDPGGTDWNLIFENGDQWGRPGLGAPLIPMVQIAPDPEINRGSYAHGLDPILGGGLFG